MKTEVRKKTSAKAKLARPKPSKATPKKSGRRAAGKSPGNGKPMKAEWNLRLYVAGQTPKSMAAFANLKRLCEQHLLNRYSIEVIDLTKHPQLAQSDQIMALPTLVRKLPEPIKRVIGDLSNVERVMIGMDLKPVEEN